MKKLFNKLENYDSFSLSAKVGIWVVLAVISGILVVLTMMLINLGSVTKQVDQGYVNSLTREEKQLLAEMEQNKLDEKELELEEERQKYVEETNAIYKEQVEQMGETPEGMVRTFDGEQVKDVPFEEVYGERAMDIDNEEDLSFAEEEKEVVTPADELTVKELNKIDPDKIDKDRISLTKGQLRYWLQVNFSDMVGDNCIDADYYHSRNKIEIVLEDEEEPLPEELKALTLIAFEKSTYGRYKDTPEVEVFYNN